MTTANATAQGDTKAAAGDQVAIDAAAKAVADQATADKATADAAAAATAEAGKASKDAAAAAAAKAAADKIAADKGGATKAPAQYALTIPEKSTIDADDVKVIETLARENDWTNDEAQSALDRHHDTLIEQSSRFLAETKADPVYGGDNLAQTQADAKAVLDRVEPATTPEGKALRALLDKSGYGNHVRIVGFLAKLGRMMAEDSPTGSGAGGGAVTTVEEKLYDGT